MSSAVVSIPQADVNVRLATMDDLPFIDSLQKKHNAMVGFMKTAALEGKIGAGHVLVAEKVRSSKLVVDSDALALTTPNSELRTPLGYIISTDRYFKRDDVGIVYQLNVVPDRQRQFIGVALLKAVFDRAAWGCKLFCCWCAQDIAANQFWEAMGFVPLAYRAGSEGRGQKSKVKGQKGPRIHIFWQKRIREGDRSTPWWFPSQTSGGAMAEARLVLPIPPGTHWSDAKAVILPGGNEGAGARDRLSGEDKRLARVAKPQAARRPLAVSQSVGGKPAPQRAAITRMSGLQFTPPVPALPAPAEKKAKEPRRKVTCPVFDPEAQTRREPRRRRNDPKLIAAARELRDRWLEHVNTSGDGALRSESKYDLSRTLSAADELRALPREGRSLLSRVAVSSFSLLTAA